VERTLSSCAHSEHTYVGRMPAIAGITIKAQQDWLSSMEILPI
jgi:hypothetical protein